MRTLTFFFDLTKNITLQLYERTSDDSQSEQRDRRDPEDSRAEVSCAVHASSQDGRRNKDQISGNVM